MKRSLVGGPNIEYTELCKTIRKQIKTGIKNFNENIVEHAIASRNSYQKAKLSLIISRKQVRAIQYQGLFFFFFIEKRHHFSQTLAILNTENCNIFENLSVHQYVRVLTLIRDMIVATDMLQHMKVLPEERRMSTEGYNPGKKSHRSLLLSLMMTCCDLNDQLKGWLYCRDIAEMIYTEFFLQGDMEKAMGRTPLDMMDREKAFIPRLQLEFLKGICIPAFTVLSKIFPSVEHFVSEIEDTATRWIRAIQWFKDNSVPESYSIDRIFDPGLEKFVLER